MISNARNLFARRDLLWTMIQSDLKTAAAESRLGWLWWMLDPLLMMLVYWVFIVIIFGRDKYAPYPIFIGCALLPWKHLAVCVGGGVKVLRAREGLIKSVPFPTMIIPLSVVISQLAYFLFGFVALWLVALVIGRPMTLTLLQIPGLVILQTLLIAGLCMAIACLGVMFHDLHNFVSHALRVGWYLSPGIYGIDLIIDRVGADSLWVKLYMLNPFAILFTGYRGCVFDPAWLPPQAWAVLMLESLVCLIGGFLIYQHYDRRVIKFL